MIARLLTVALFMVYLGSTAGHAQRKGNTFTIDGEVWTLVREAAHCKDRVNFAISEYWKVPLYSNYRSVEAERFLIDDTSDCWVELYVSGVDHVNPMFKISNDGNVLDKKILFYWGQELRPFPTTPYAHESDSDLLNQAQSLPPPPEEQ